MPTKGCGLITVAAAANFTAAAKEIKEGDNVLLKTPAPSMPANQPTLDWQEDFLAA